MIGKESKLQLLNPVTVTIRDQLAIWWTLPYLLPGWSGTVILLRPRSWHTRKLYILIMTLFGSSGKFPSINMVAGIISSHEMPRGDCHRRVSTMKTKDDLPHPKECVLLWSEIYVSSRASVISIARLLTRASIWHVAHQLKYRSHFRSSSNLCDEKKLSVDSWVFVVVDIIQLNNFTPLWECKPSIENCKLIWWQEMHKVQPFHDRGRGKQESHWRRGFGTCS